MAAAPDNASAAARCLELRQSGSSGTMRIAIVCNDTRGGVQPYVALGQGLARAGHDVRAVAPAEFAPMFESVGVAMVPLSGGKRAAELRSTGVAERGVIAAMRFMRRELPAQINQWTRETLAACEGVDVMTGGIGGMVTGLSVAEKLQIPFVETHLQPIGVPTDAYPGVMMPWWPRWLGSTAMHLSHHLSDRAAWMAFKKPMASARETVLGLTGRPDRMGHQPVLYGFSRHVVPMPANEKRFVCGYWSLTSPTPRTPTTALEAFLMRDGPVVSIGFGSMASSNPQQVTDLVLSAVRHAGVRAVLLSGWGGLASLPEADNVWCADDLPHDWLFPRVTAVVHHGGAGTTGAALTAGVPALVIPFAADQPFWGARVAALGAGPVPIARQKLTAELLASALRRMVDDQPMRARAAELGGLMRCENGVAAAVTHFETLRL
jgi:sterol 3beta-glucosyltransferase